jgi:hypothetical protein
MSTMTGQHIDGFVRVPRVPTKHMLDAAREASLAEDAAWVWDSMIGAFTEAGESLPEAVEDSPAS